MKSFSELLSDYIRRLGVSDAELARSLGVRRQTIFRWREGLTSRPRHRVDVMRLAEKLRLTDEERDTLLLAAGFSPESADITIDQAPDQPDQTADGTLPASNDLSDAETLDSIPPPVLTNDHLAPNPPEPTQVDFASEQTGRNSINRKVMGLGAGLVAIVLLVMGLSGIVPGVGGDGTATSVSRQQPTISLNQEPTPSPLPTKLIRQASPHETVILVTHFKNYAGPGFNVRDRLQAVLQDEVEAAKLTDFRVETWEEEVSLRRFAIQAGQAVSATLIIFGEYDAGRVVAQFVHPAAEQRFKDEGWIQEISDLQELSATINQDLPNQIRPLALLILGQTLIAEDRFEPARLALEQARATLLSDPGANTDTLATIDLHRGLAYANGQQPQYDAAIKAYTAAFDSNPRLNLARFNRGIAYHARQKPGDLALALADMEAVIRRSPRWAAAYNNRAAIRLDMGGAENFEKARADLDKALALNPELPSPYVNRAFLSYIEGEPFATWKADIDQALTLESTHAKALNMMCWGHAINQLAEFGFPYCEQAVAEDPSPVIRDSRGLAHGLLGNAEEAIADFEVYITWLEERNRESEAESRRAWIEALARGENPFTPEVMKKLRREK